MSSSKEPSLPLIPSSEIHRRVSTELRDLAKLVVERKVQFLCGAGMSKASGSLLAPELSAEIIKDMLGHLSPDDVWKLVRSYPFEAVAGAFLEEKDPIRLKRLVRTAVDRGEEKIHAGHTALAYLANQSYIDKVYTTNFDRLIEHALGVRQCTVTDDNAYLIYEAQAENKIPVIHLHGTLESPKYHITERDTYNLDTGLARIMMADMVTHWFVWVGYSLNDVDLRSLYLSMREILARTDDLIKKPYVAHPLTLEGDSREEELILANALWRSRGARFIPLRAEEFLPMLVDYVRRIEGEGLARILAEKYGLDPHNDDHIKEVWRKAKELGDTLPLDNELQALQILAQKEGVEVKQS